MGQKYLDNKADECPVNINACFFLAFYMQILFGREIHANMKNLFTRIWGAGIGARYF